MSQHCTGLCNFYHSVKASEMGAIKADIPVKIRANRYVGSLFLLGYKRCSLCEIYLDYSKIMCPCCSIKLSTMPRNRNGKFAVKGELKRY